MSLNQILYGPPGTGKTYSTIGLSVKLIDGTLDDNHVINKLRFDELRKAGQIEFITFHQNYSYEDFMVGLRPDPNEDKLKFYPYKGAFYRIAQAARTNYLDSKENKGIIKDFDTILLEMFQPVDAGNEVEVKMASGISFYVTDYNDNTIYFRKSNNSTSHTLSIATLKELVEGTRILNSGLIVYYNPLAKEIQQRQQPISEMTTPLKNFVLVIDEINRANISRVFGELITLLEDDKRLGQPNELTVSLPNGEINFGVPPNLYVLGTMNTADKSIALIDIALRRRFEFVGKYPDYEVLINAGLAERADLLRKINLAIFNKKNTADYLIGHAYFLAEQDISIILLKKIIPLLNEYFGNRFDDVKSVFNQTEWTAIFDTESYCWQVKKSEKNELAGANI
jgi:5-methylcytosine-specific restriction protein B